MTKTKAVTYASLVAILLLYGWFRLRRHDNASDHSISSVVLPTTDREKLIVDEHTHTITIVSRTVVGKTQSKKEFLPPHASFEVKNDGTVKVQTRAYGTEISPSVGFGIGTDVTLRAAGNVGLLYAWRIEAGLGVASGSRLSSARFLASIGYNVYDNVMVSAYVDNQKSIGALLTIKL
jgi:hypothetical protein